MEKVVIFVYMCMRVYVEVCVCVCLRVCVYVCVCVRTQAQVPNTHTLTEVGKEWLGKKTSSGEPIWAGDKVEQ